MITPTNWHISNREGDFYMHYGKLLTCDIANGVGVRVTLFASGCTNKCKGCFQPETWNFKYGKPYTSETEKEVLSALGLPGRQGLTLLGGEPFEPENQRELVKLLRKVKTLYPDKNVWCYTGFLYDNLIKENYPKHCEVTYEMLSMIDTLVDGPFMEELKDLTLKYRGSANQRILDRETMDQILEQYRGLGHNKSVESIISNVLRDLNIPAHLSGYKYLKESILFALENNNAGFITKDTYPHVAEKYNTTVDRVERAIRNAIKTRLPDCTHKIKTKIFGDKSTPTNKEFVASVANYISQMHK
jgi:anaerobic ribonucleoside-triphosphate reductase activating protein